MFSMVEKYIVLRCVRFGSLADIRARIRDVRSDDGRAISLKDDLPLSWQARLAAPDALLMSLKERAPVGIITAFGVRGLHLSDPAALTER